MKIAVTSKGKGLGSEVDPRFGRAAMFVIHDTDNDSIESVSNEQNVNASQGAGIQAAQTLSQAGAEVVITGHCGPNAFHALSAAGIKVVLGAKGTVANTLEAFKAGSLKTSEAPDVNGHWA